MIARLGLRELRRHGPSDSAACARAIQQSFKRLGVVAGTRGVPPVGVEPTLGTLLGGRPLPLGYGGIAMIPRAHLLTPDIQLVETVSRPMSPI